MAKTTQPHFAILVIVSTLVLMLLCTQTRAQEKNNTETLIRNLALAKDYKDSVKSYCAIAGGKRREEQHEVSKFYARCAVRLCKQHNDQGRLGTAYFHVAQAFFEHEKFDSAKYYAELSIKAYDSAHVKHLYYPYVTNMIGAYYLNRGNLTTALDYAHRQMDVAIQIKDTASISNAYTMLAAVYGLMDNVGEVLQYTKKALEINRLSGLVLNRALVLANLANVYLELNEPDSAMIPLVEMLHIATHESKSLRSEGMAYMYLGKCYSLMQNYDTAIYFLRNAGSIIRPLEDTICMGEILRYTGETYWHKGKYDSALVYLDRSYRLLQQGGVNGFAVDILRVKSEVLAEAGAYSDAYLTLRQYKTFNDSIFNADMRDKIARLREQYESEKKDGVIAQQQSLTILLKKQTLLQAQKLRSEMQLKEMLQSKNELAQLQIVSDSVVKVSLDRENTSKRKQLAQAEELNGLLAEDNKLRAAALERQHTINSLLAGGIVIVLLFTGLTVAQYRRQKAANSMILMQSDKLKLLMKELHHRVKNNLQIISSLLSLQSFRIKDEAASKAVREGQQRIEAMSLIHQRLYTRDNITEINIREFITDLVESLQNAYGYREDDITISLDIASERMDVDQAIPLSLIINELVTNVFKYACEDNSHPELTIKLLRVNDSIHLSVADNGRGINIEEWKEKEGSFGKELIRTFVKQLNGYLDLTVNSGTQFRLTIPVAA
jgi:two-component sensor histidine kinase